MNKFLTLLITMILSISLCFTQTIDVTVIESENGTPGSVEAEASDPSLMVNFKWTDEQGNILLQESGNSSTISNLPLGSTVCLHATTYDIACDLSIPAEMFECFTITGNSCNGFPATLQVREADKNSPICSCCDDGALSVSFTNTEGCFFDNDASLYGSFRWLDDNSTSPSRSGLTVGTYCVEYSLSNQSPCDPGCKTIECFEIESSLESPLEISSIKVDICRSSILHTDNDPNTFDWIETVTTNGWISITPSFGDGDYSIQWLDGSNAGFDRIISEPGQYCALISDQCGDEIIECWQVSVIETNAYCLQYPGYLGIVPLSSSDINGLFNGLTSSWAVFPDTFDLNVDIHSLFESFDNEQVLYQIKTKNSVDIGLYKLEKLPISAITTNAIEHPDIKHVSTINQIKSVQVYPNPSNSEVYLEINLDTPMKVNIDIIDIYGKIVYLNSIDLVKGENTTKVGVSELSSGIYFLNVNNKFYSKISIVR